MGQAQWGGGWRGGRGGQPVFIISWAIDRWQGNATRAYGKVGAFANPGQGTKGEGTGNILPQDFLEANRAVQFP